MKRLVKINGRKIRESSLMKIEVEFNNMAASKGEMRVAPSRKVKPLVQFSNIDL